MAARVIGGTITVREGDEGLITRDSRSGCHRIGPHGPLGTGDGEGERKSPGKFDADIVAGEAGRVKLVSDGLALEALSPLLHRFDIKLNLTGSLTADFSAMWGQDTASLEGSIGGKNLAISGPWLNGDTLCFASANLPVKAAMTGPDRFECRGTCFRHRNDRGHGRVRARRAF